MRSDLRFIPTFEGYEIFLGHLGLDFRLLFFGMDVRELAVIVTEVICMYLTTALLTEVAYAAGKTEERLHRQEVLPFRRLGLALRIEPDVEIHEQGTEELSIRGRRILAIQLDQEFGVSFENAFMTDTEART